MSNCISDDEATEAVTAMHGELTSRYCLACSADLAANLYVNLLTAYCLIIEEKDSIPFADTLDRELMHFRQAVAECRAANSPSPTSY